MAAYREKNIGLIQKTLSLALIFVFVCAPITSAQEPTTQTNSQYLGGNINNNGSVVQYTTTLPGGTDTTQSWIWDGSGSFGATGLTPNDLIPISGAGVSGTPNSSGGSSGSSGTTGSGSAAPTGGVTAGGVAGAAGQCTISGFVGNATKGAMSGIIGKATSWLKNTLTKGITGALSSILPGTAVVPVKDDKTRENTASIRTNSGELVNKEVGIGADTGGGGILGGIADLIKPPSLDALAFCIANEIIHQIMRSTIQWVNSGFQGKPVFIDNPELFFKNIANKEAGLLVRQIAGNTLGVDVCQPFRMQVAVDTIRAQTQSYGGRGGRGNCTLDTIKNNYQGFMNNYNQGGLPGWFELIQKPNNYYGAGYQAQAERLRVTQQRQNTLKMELNWADGYRNFKYCDGPKRADGSCDPAHEFTGTPGKIIENTINQRLNSPQNRIEIADEFDELISALVNALIKTAINEVLSIGDDDDSGGGSGSRPAGDVTKPTIAITAPVTSSTASGTVPIAATATDNTGISFIQFWLDGTRVINTDGSSPYQIGWNTTLSTNGTHTLTAVARDVAGNTATSSPVSVIIANTDTVPPSVSLSFITNGATLTGTTTISATASDNVAVRGVQFILDNNVFLQTEDTTSPYSIIWNTRTISNGSHTLKAVAKDMLNNMTTSNSVSIIISNPN